MNKKSVLILAFSLTAGSFAANSEPLRPARQWLATNAYLLLTPGPKSISASGSPRIVPSERGWEVSSCACATPAAPSILGFANPSSLPDPSTPFVAAGSQPFYDLYDQSPKSILGPLRATDSIRRAPLLPLSGAPPSGSTSVASIHGGERGGGDQVAAEFLAAARAFLRDLAQLHELGHLPEIDEKRVARAIAEFRIDVYDTPITDSAGVPRGAVTDLGKKAIELSRPLWTASGTNRLSRWTLVVHEILRASGYFQEDDLYAWTQNVMNALQADDLPFSHLLNLSSSNIDTVLFQKQLANRDLRCQWEVEGVNRKKTVLFRDSPYGLEIVLRSGQGKEQVYSETLRNITQISFGMAYTLFGLSADENNARVLLIQTPAAGAESISGMRYSHKIKQTEGTDPASVFCEIDPKK